MAPTFKNARAGQHDHAQHHPVDLAARLGVAVVHEAHHDQGAAEHGGGVARAARVLQPRRLRAAHRKRDGEEDDGGDTDAAGEQAERPHRGRLGGGLEGPHPEQVGDEPEADEAERDDAERARHGADSDTRPRAST